ncbi:MAG: hypothetical protein IJB93_06535 [Clostridia bacterium]|nr:hypothetical protein [Clostridia bacterium]
MKKFIAITLTVLMLFSAMVFTAAAEDEVVAKMWYCNATSKKTGIGHVFLYFKNLTDQPIKVGRYEVPPYDDVSVGCFGTEGPRGAGVYYNLEQDLTHYRAPIGVSEELTAGELQKVTDKIRNYKNHWDPFLNCYYFASKCWNAGADGDIPYLLIPGFTRLIIRIRGAESGFVDLFSQNDPVYRQNELPG